MNISVLTKCVDELKKDSPDIRYILGMLETLIALTGGSSVGVVIPQIGTATFSTTTNGARVDEEGDLPRGYATGRIGKIT